MTLSAGGDSDSIAAMAGALAGAHLGETAIPSRWLEAMERGAVDRARALADALGAARVDSSPS